MAANDAQSDPEFVIYQQELDSAFHSRTDVFPAGTPEHAELLSFVAKLYKLRKAKPETATDGGTPSDPALAEHLGLPSTYNARFRINASLVAPPERIGAAVRAIARRMAQREAARVAAAAAPGPRGGSTTRWDGRDGRGGGAGSGGGGGGVTPDIVERASEMVEEYRRLLPWFEDFHQRRQMARLRKLQADRAALPAAGYREAIVSALAASQTLVVAGDTGCGKSTQIPQFLAAAGYRRIAVTQPRRISAVSLARRVAVEACDAHGSSVAFKVRFSSSVAADSRIVFCTEGILLRELVSDPTLASYDVVVLDEVHERHLTTDFLLALIRAQLLQRPELRLVLMSATINCGAFADYFGGAPIVQIPGRLYPIQLVYVPPETESEEARRREGGRRGAAGRSGGVAGGRSSNPAADQIDPAPYQRLLQRIDSEIPSSQRGDLLIFVAGTADITALCTALAPYAEQTRRWVLLPLHAGLPLEAQEKVFDMPPEGVRKAIIATNIAETSLTIDGVRFVADSGRAKEMIHDVASGGGSLQEGWISRASADQRKGRAGRTGPGTCYRVYSEAQYNDMRAFSAPEIARVRLEAVVLGIKAMAGSAMDPRVFGFIDPPPPDRLEASITNLKQIGALSQTEALTPLGAVLSLLPVDVAIGKLLVLGCMFGMAGPALTLAAALSVQSPFLRLGDEEQDQDAKAARASLVSPHGDALTLLNVFEAWLAVKQGAGQGGGVGPAWSRGGAGGSRGGGGAVSSAKWCRRHGLAEARLYEMAKLRAQFAELLADAGILRAGGGTALSAGQGGASHRRHHHRRHAGRAAGGGGLRGAELHAARRRLRDMQAERERQRGRKVLRVEGSGGAAGSGGRRRGPGAESASSGSGSDSEESSSSGEEELERLHDLDLRVHVDVAAMAAEASRPLSPSDVGLLRHLLAVGLYPRVAVGDEANQQRREQDCRFYTAQVSDLVIHPGSSLYGYSNNLPRGQILLYQELIETRRQYLSCVTPLWSLPALLLSARRLDCDTGATRWLVDGWLLLRVHDGAGPKVLQLVMELRSGSAHLISSRLRAANLAALSAVQTFEDDGVGDDEVAAAGPLVRGAAATAVAAEPAAPSGTFQRGYAAFASALPEELRPLLSGVFRQQAEWRAEEATRRRREQERLAQRRAAVEHGRGGVDEDHAEKEEGSDGGGGRGAAAAVADAELEDLLAGRLCLDTWPCRYSLERLPPGNKVTAQFITPSLQPLPGQSQIQAQGQGQDQSQGRGQGPGQSQPSAATGRQGAPQDSTGAPLVAAVTAAAAGAGAVVPPGGAGGAAGVDTDPLGVPYECAGVWLAPWLRYGSLRSFESAMALHALQPALRKAWLCPGCGQRLVATFADVQAHVAACEAVRGVDAQAVETMGYAQAATAPAPVHAAGGARRGGGGGGSGSKVAGAMDDGPLAARVVEGSGGGDGGGGEGDSTEVVADAAATVAAGARDAIGRLEAYLETPPRWGRRRPSAPAFAVSGRDVGSWRAAADGDRHVRQPGPGDGRYGRRDDGDRQGAAQQQQPGGAPGTRLGAGVELLASAGAGTGANVSASAGAGAGAARAALFGAGSAGGGSGGGGLGGGEEAAVRTVAAAPPPATARPYKCPVCGLEELMTPPQILQHKRQHG